MIPEIHTIKDEKELEIYGPDDKFVGVIKDELSFVDFRIQIAENKLEGYYYIIIGDKSSKKNYIKSNGIVEFDKEYPFILHEKMLAKLIKISAKNV